MPSIPCSHRHSQARRFVGGAIPEAARECQLHCARRARCSPCNSPARRVCPPVLGPSATARACGRGRAVDALLDKIERDGGRSGEASTEIIRLAPAIQFVTPYTSFLAVPRALLRLA